MTVIINPIFNEQVHFESTINRFRSMFRPIQGTEYKNSDFCSYILSPVIDVFVLEPMYALEIAIHLLNATASLLKAAYLWVLNQQNTDSLVDLQTDAELTIAFSQTMHALSASVAETFNSVFSILSLVTRPIASLIHACSIDAAPDLLPPPPLAAQI
jgi:hypothetical protein